MKTKNMTVICIIASIYTVLSFILAPISFGAIQLRFAESLNVLVLLSPIYGYGVILGCFVTNFIGVLQGSNILGFIDCLVGTAATSIASFLAYRLKDRRIKNIPFFSLLSIVLSNAIIIGLELAFVLMKDNLFIGFIIFFVQVSIGEILSTIIGMFLYKKIQEKE